MNNIGLRVATIEDRPTIYHWLAHSDATAEMMGPPTYTECPVPSFEEFCADYEEAAFVEGGDFQIVIVSVEGREVGVAQFWIQQRSAELDIWIADRELWGRGIGSETLRRLLLVLKDSGEVDFAVIRPSARNVRAVAAYKKAGFEEFDRAKHELPRIFVDEGFDYDDAVILVQQLR